MEEQIVAILGEQEAGAPAVSLKPCLIRHTLCQASEHLDRVETYCARDHYKLDYVDPALAPLNVGDERLGAAQFGGECCLRDPSRLTRTDQLRDHLGIRVGEVRLRHLALASKVQRFRYAQFRDI